MATVKIRFNRLAAPTIRYVLDHGRSGDPVDGENCTPDPKTLIDQFAGVREMHGFKDGNQVTHIIQSWGPEESKQLSPNAVNTMGRELAGRYFPGHQFFVATHTDREHVHNHIVVSTVHLETGKRIHNKMKHLHELRNINDDICRARGLSVPNQAARERDARMPDKVQRMVRFGRFSYLMDIRQKADFSRAYATNYDEYVGILGELGVSARVEPKNISYFYPGQARGKRGKNLGRLYDKPGLEQAFRENDERFRERPEIRNMVRGKIDQLRERPEAIDRLAREVTAATSGESIVAAKKDYGRSTHVPRREAQRGLEPARDVSRSIVPISEISRARRTNIVDYCRRQGIPVERHQDGTCRLRDRDYVVLDAFEWSNTKNNTKGSLIDLVAAHKTMTFLQAIAHINDNPRLLLLEQHFGEQKRTYTSFYVPKCDQATHAEALGKVSDLLSSMHIEGRHAEHLLKGPQVQVSRGGTIRFFGKDGGDGALEFTQDDHGRWQRRPQGAAHSPFAAVSGTGHGATVYLDPFSFIQKAGGATPGPKHGDAVLALLSPNPKVIDHFVAEHPHIDRVTLVHGGTNQASPVELDLFHNLKQRYHNFGIEVDLLSVERLSRGRGHELSR